MIPLLTLNPSVVPAATDPNTDSKAAGDSRGKGLASAQAEAEVEPKAKVEVEEAETKGKAETKEDDSEHTPEDSPNNPEPEPEPECLFTKFAKGAPYTLRRMTTYLSWQQICVELNDLPVEAKAGSALEMLRSYDRNLRVYRYFLRVMRKRPFHDADAQVVGQLLRTVRVSRHYHVALHPQLREVRARLVRLHRARTV